MDTTLSPEDIEFRSEVRDFFKQTYTPEMVARMNDPEDFRHAQIDWQKALYKKGWIAPNWPEEHGGSGWSAMQNFIYETERGAHGARDVIPFGLKMVGPVIYSFGNDEQKARFLPRILSSEDWWCQGYSEPGAGSDLAALQTKAVLDGDEYVVNGAKIWTTYAQYADWIFCLVRTDSSGKRQSGITFLLIDMKSPGITVRPIHSIDNNHTLNEVQFKDVRVPVANRIGEQDAGWTYAKALLAHERVSIAEVANSQRNLREVKSLASQEINAGQALIDDPAFQAKLANVEIELMALQYTELRVLASIAGGEHPGPESSLLKIKGTEIQQAIQELRMEVAGYYCGLLPNQLGAEQVGHSFGNQARNAYMYGRAASIYGGSNEVQRNVIARAVLRL